MSGIVFVSELYFPESTSTGFFVTGIAEGLAATGGLKVSVLCSQPSYSQKGLVAPRSEVRNEVSIQRVSCPAGNKNRLLSRIWLSCVLTVRFGFSTIFNIQRGDMVIVLTNPPSLPLITGLVCRIKRAAPVLLVHDVYPDVLIPTGLTRERSFLYRAFDFVQRRTLKSYRHIIVLGRDMRIRMEAKLPVRSSEKISIIPNWGDEVKVRPDLRKGNHLRSGLDLQNKFVIQFSGNLGRTHGLEDLVALARYFRSDSRVHFVVFGWGAGRAWLEKMIIEDSLENVTLLEPCPDDELGVYLTSCDLFLMLFKSGMKGISVPSRLYNVMAAGSPLLAVCDEDSELGLVVQEESIGWVVEPGDTLRMAGVVEEAISSPDLLLEMGRRARMAMESKYTRSIVIQQYVELVQSVCGMHNKVEEGEEDQ